MISNVALQSTDASGATPAAGEPGEPGDTGVFDALLALHELITADAATAANTQLAGTQLAGTQLAGTLEGANLLADTLQDSAEDSSTDSTEDGTQTADPALWFLAAPLPALKVPAPAVTVGPAMAVRIHNDATLGAPPAGTPHAGTPPPGTAQANAAADLVQTFASGAAVAEAANPLLPNSQGLVPINAATPAIDTATWNSLTAPAELFAQGARSGATERADSAPLTTHVRDPRWADELGQRLASMVRTGESSASLQMTPPDLGPLEVNVAVRDNQATVHFGAANAETRALLEASMPRLREMLASQGFQLMDSSVSHGFARQTRHESAGTPRVDGLGEGPTTSATAIRITGLLDLYA